MSKPRLPSRPADTWEGGFLFDSPRLVNSISARGGLVIAGGEDLYLLRPGAEGMLTRPATEAFGCIEVAAAEPRAPRRYAVSSEEMITVFYRKGGEDQILRLRPQTPGALVTHLAWGGTSGLCALYLRRDDGSVARLKSDLSDLEELDLPSMSAIASDETGVIAMISFEPEPRAYVTRDGEAMQFRSFDHDADPSQIVYLAVADTAVAFAVENEGAFLSRKQEDPFLACEALAGAGPVEFEGSSSDAALFGGVLHASMASIDRVDRDGAAIRIAEMGSDTLGPPVLQALSWDASRRKLWAASGVAGIMTSTAPSAKRGKKAPLS
jgi:hypothetical protein